MLHENREVTQSFVPGKHCSLTFTHECATGMSMDLARQWADNILRVLGDGEDPPVTAVHHERILSDALPPGMTQQYIQQIQSFDVAKSNAAFRQGVPKVGGYILFNCSWYTHELTRSVFLTARVPSAWRPSQPAWAAWWPRAWQT